MNNFKYQDFYHSVIYTINIETQRLIFICPGLLMWHLIVDLGTLKRCRISKFHVWLNKPVISLLFPIPPTCAEPPFQRGSCDVIREAVPCPGGCDLLSWKTIFGPPLAAGQRERPTACLLRPFTVSLTPSRKSLLPTSLPLALPACPFQSPYAPLSPVPR